MVFELQPKAHWKMAIFGPHKTPKFSFWGVFLSYTAQNCFKFGLYICIYTCSNWIWRKIWKFPFFGFSQRILSIFFEKVNFLHVHAKLIFYSQMTRNQAGIWNTGSQNASPKKYRGNFEFLWNNRKICDFLKKKVNFCYFFHKTGLKRLIFKNWKIPCVFFGDTFWETVFRISAWYLVIWV